MFSVIQRIRKRLPTRYPQMIVLRVNISSDTVRAQSTNHFYVQNPIGPRSRVENLVVLCFFLPKQKRYDYVSYLFVRNHVCFPRSSAWAQLTYFPTQIHLPSILTTCRCKTFFRPAFTTPGKTVLWIKNKSTTIDSVFKRRNSAKTFRNAYCERILRKSRKIPLK